MIKATGQVRVRLSSTGEEHQVDAAQLEWDAIECDARQDTQETHWQTTLELTDDKGREHIIEWNVWEYPTGMVNHEETSPSSDVKILTDLQVAIVDDD